MTSVCANHPPAVPLPRGFLVSATNKVCKREQRVT